jgi:predicted GNAT family acetyltransferase
MENFDNIELINNTQGSKKKFELSINNHVAFIEYILAKDNKIYLTHTEVPSALGGKGVGSALVKKVLNYIRNKGYTLIPLCPFVAAYLKKHQEYVNLLDSNYKIG